MTKNEVICWKVSLSQFHHRIVIARKGKNEPCCGNIADSPDEAISLHCLTENFFGYSTMNEHEYFVYILTNKYNKVLYTGVTNDLQRRVLQHRTGKAGSFTSRYKVIKLVYFEMTVDVYAAIAREKQIKGGSRQDKIDLVNSINPEWNDLYVELFEENE